MPPKSLLPTVWNVPVEFRARLGDRVGKQRAMTAEGHLLLVLHRPPGANQAERVGRYFWREPTGGWHGFEPGGAAISLANHLAELRDLFDRLDAREDAATTAREYFEVLGAVGPVLRSSRHLHAVLQQAREALPHERDLINFRDQAYELERSFELLQGDTQNGLQHAVAWRAEQQAESSRRMALAAYRLNLLAAFFFPLATLSAVMGANLQHGLETLPPPVPFLVFVATGLAAGALLAGYLFARKDS
jgi:hypothetical protein